MNDQFEQIDFALAAFRDAGQWQVQEIADTMLNDIETLSSALRHLPSDVGSIGLVGVDEDFFVIVRVTPGTTAVLLSDVTAADEWPLARSCVEYLQLPLPDDEEVPAPAGDLGLLEDLGMHAMDLGVLIEDFELYPDEMLSDVADRLGFGELFDDLVGFTTA